MATLSAPPSEASTATSIGLRSPLTSTSTGVTSTEVTGRTDFTELLVLLNHAKRGCWVFTLYNTVAAREEVVTAIRRVIAPLPVFDWTYTPESPYPISYLKDLSEVERANRAVIFLFDLERGSDEVWKSLDYNREEFASHPHGIVIWVTSAGRVAAARKAPHFWAQRSSVFDFSVSKPERQAELRSEWTGRGLSIESYDDALRQLRLYQGLLDEYLVLPDTPPETLVDLHGKVARLLHYLDRREEALPYLQEQLELARKLEDKDLQAEALTNLAVIERIRSGASAAVNLLEQAYTLAFNPYLRAEVLFNLGATLFTQGGSDRSLDLLQEARMLFTQVGDKLGQANVLKAIGDVQSFRKEMDAALQSYEQARTLFTQVGDKLGQANVYLAIGQLKDDMASFERAIQIYELIRDSYSIARGKYFFGRSLLNAGDLERGLSLLHEARAGWKQIKFEAGVNAVNEILQLFE